ATWLLVATGQIGDGRLTRALSCPKIKIQVDAACEGNPVVGNQKQGNDRRNVKRRTGALFLFALPQKGDIQMSAHNGFQQFVNDDDGYLLWLAQNPDGFVVNSNRVPVSSYLILHRASCKWINTSTRTNWTTTGYIKTCSNDLTALTEWAEREVGGSLKHCQSCQPDPRSRTTPTRRLDPISETKTEVWESWAASPSATSQPPGKRSLPP